MKKIYFPSRALALWLTLSLSLPNPALALREEQKADNRAGLEELEQALRSGDPRQVIRLASAALTAPAARPEPFGKAVRPELVEGRTVPVAAAGAEEDEGRDEPKEEQDPKAPFQVFGRIARETFSGWDVGRSSATVSLPGLIGWVLPDGTQVRIAWLTTDPENPGNVTGVLFREELGDPQITLGLLLDGNQAQDVRHSFDDVDAWRGTMKDFSDLILQHLRGKSAEGKTPPFTKVFGVVRKMNQALAERFAPGWKENAASAEEDIEPGERIPAAEKETILELSVDAARQFTSSNMAYGFGRDMDDSELEREIARRYKGGPGAKGWSVFLQFFQGHLSLDEAVEEIASNPAFIGKFGGNEFENEHPYLAKVTLAMYWVIAEYELWDVIQDDPELRTGLWGYAEDGWEGNKDAAVDAFQRHLSAGEYSEARIRRMLEHLDRLVGRESPAAGAEETGIAIEEDYGEFGLIEAFEKAKQLVTGNSVQAFSVSFLPTLAITFPIFFKDVTHGIDVAAREESSINSVIPFRYRLVRMDGTKLVRSSARTDVLVMLRLSEGDVYEGKVPRHVQKVIRDFGGMDYGQLATFLNLLYPLIRTSGFMAFEDLEGKTSLVDDKLLQSPSEVSRTLASRRGRVNLSFELRNSIPMLVVKELRSEPATGAKAEDLKLANEIAHRMIQRNSDIAGTDILLALEYPNQDSVYTEIIKSVFLEYGITLDRAALQEAPRAHKLLSLVAAALDELPRSEPPAAGAEEWLPILEAPELREARKLFIAIVRNSLRRVPADATDGMRGREEYSGRNLLDTNHPFYNRTVRMDNPGQFKEQIWLFSAEPTGPDSQMTTILAGDRYVLETTVLGMTPERNALLMHLDGRWYQVSADGAYLELRPGQIPPAISDQVANLSTGAEEKKERLTEAVRSFESKIQEQFGRFHGDALKALESGKLRNWNAEDRIFSLKGVAFTLPEVLYRWIDQGDFERGRTQIGPPIEVLQRQKAEIDRIIDSEQPTEHQEADLAIPAGEIKAYQKWLNDLMNELRTLQQQFEQAAAGAEEQVEEFLANLVQAYHRISTADFNNTVDLEAQKIRFNLERLLIVGQRAGKTLQFLDRLLSPGGEWSNVTEHYTLPVGSLLFQIAFANRFESQRPQLARLALEVLQRLPQPSWAEGQNEFLRIQEALQGMEGPKLKPGFGAEQFLSLLLERYRHVLAVPEQDAPAAYDEFFEFQKLAVPRVMLKETLIVLGGWLKPGGKIAQDGSMVNAAIRMAFATFLRKQMDFNPASVKQLSGPELLGATDLITRELLSNLPNIEMTRQFKNDDLPALFVHLRSAAYPLDGEQPPAAGAEEIAQNAAATLAEKYQLFEGGYSAVFLYLTNGITLELAVAGLRAANDQTVPDEVTAKHILEEARTLVETQADPASVQGIDLNSLEGRMLVIVWLLRAGKYEAAKGLITEESSLSQQVLFDESLASDIRDVLGLERAAAQIHQIQPEVVARVITERLSEIQESNLNEVIQMAERVETGGGSRYLEAKENILRRLEKKDQPPAAGAEEAQQSLIGDYRDKRFHFQLYQGGTLRAADNVLNRVDRIQIPDSGSVMSISSNSAGHAVVNYWIRSVRVGKETKQGRMVTRIFDLVSDQQISVSGEVNSAAGAEEERDWTLEVDSATDKAVDLVGQSRVKQIIFRDGNNFVHSLEGEDLTRNNVSASMKHVGRTTNTVKMSLSQETLSVVLYAPTLQEFSGVGVSADPWPPVTILKTAGAEEVSVEVAEGMARMADFLGRIGSDPSVLFGAGIHDLTESFGESPEIEAFEREGVQPLLLVPGRVSAPAAPLDSPAMKLLVEPRYERALRQQLSFALAAGIVRITADPAQARFVVGGREFVRSQKESRLVARDATFLQVDPSTVGSLTQDFLAMVAAYKPGGVLVIGTQTEHSDAVVLFRSA